MARRGRPRHPDVLTPREWEVLALVRDGLTNEQIAERLGITPRTAKYHVSEILSKLGLRDRREAAAWQPEARRPWWATAITPLAGLRRKLTFGWLSPAIAGGLALLVLGGLGLLLWGLTATRNGSHGEPGLAVSASHSAADAEAATVTATQTVSAQDSQAPRALTSLPEGTLLLEGGAMTGPAPAFAIPMFAISGSRAIRVAAANANVVSPDGGHVAYLERVSNDWTVPPTALVVRRNDGTETFRVSPPPSGPLQGPIWSPTGERLAFQAGSTIYLRDADGGQAAEFPAPPADLRSWLGGSSLLLQKSKTSDADRAHVYIMDAVSGHVSEVLPPPGAAFSANTDFSPDGRFASYGTGDCFAGCDLWVMEVATGRTCLVMADAPSRFYPQKPDWSPDGSRLTYSPRYDRTSGMGDLRAFDLESCASEEVWSGDVHDTTWSPGGGYVAMTSQPPGRLYLWQPGGQRSTVEVPARSLEWSHDGTLLAAHTGNGVTVVDPVSGSAQEYIVADVNPLIESVDLLWSPSNRYLLISATRMAMSSVKGGGPPPTGEGRFYILDRQTGAVQALIDERREFRPVAWAP